MLWIVKKRSKRKKCAFEEDRMSFRSKNKRCNFKNNKNLTKFKNVNNSKNSSVNKLYYKKSNTKSTKAASIKVSRKTVQMSWNWGSWELIVLGWSMSAKCGNLNWQWLLSISAPHNSNTSKTRDRVWLVPPTTSSNSRDSSLITANSSKMPPNRLNSYKKQVICGLSGK